MSYSNTFLRDFAPVFHGIVQRLQIKTNLLAVEVVDEEDGSYSIFELADVLDALEQIAPELNFLTIYTGRAAYFYEFAEKMYEENGLIITFLPKREFKRARQAKTREECPTLVLDFEWEGSPIEGAHCAEKYYVPIHKRPWEKLGNLDIVVPIGYNTVIVKGVLNCEKKPGRDRLEQAFYDE